MTEGIFIYKTEKAPVKGAGTGRDTEESALQAVITGLVQERRHVEVPASIGGCPVVGIAPHAFAEKAQMRSLSLPDTLRSVGAFAFHNCPQLEEIALFDSIHDFHNGVVRQDMKLHRIRLTVREGNYTVMRDILSDTDAKLQFSLQLPDGEVRLLFPGYDYAFNENTMARTIQFSISGSGMVYRECVKRKGIGFREYDRLFSRVIPDDPHAAAEIAADRLLFPYDLASVHAQAYEKYLRENAKEALARFVKNIRTASGTESGDEAYMRLQLMAERGLISAEAADGALRLASDLGLTEACSIIMSGREAAFRKRQGMPGRVEMFSLPEDPQPEEELPDLFDNASKKTDNHFFGDQHVLPQKEEVPAGPGAAKESALTGALRAAEDGADLLSLEDW